MLCKNAVIETSGVAAQFSITQPTVLLGWPTNCIGMELAWSPGK